jgi:CubicO group peptidase (beta-lactamase class C family)
LAFLFDPGTKFGYSGEGMNYLARFAERKLGRSFEDLVEEHVFGPIGMRQASLTERPWMAGRVAIPVDSADKVGKLWLHPKGKWSAAGDLFITVTDLARFVISVMNGEGLGAELAAERNRIQVSTERAMPCFVEPKTLCPTAMGYGLGWVRFDYGPESMIFHGGDNPGDHALALYYPHTRDGVVVTLNGGSRYVIPEAMDLFDSHPPIAAFAGVGRSPWGRWMRTAIDGYLAGKWPPE